MTSASEQQPSPAPAASRQPVWLAGILGGVLGALFSFALARSLPTPAKPVTLAPAPSSDARPLADELIGFLQAKNHEEFLKRVRHAFAGLNEEQFGQVRSGLQQMRDGNVTAYGSPIGFDFVRETSLGPNLARFAYLERFQRGAVIWIVVFYNPSDAWQVLGYKQIPLEAAFEMLR